MLGLLPVICDLFVTELWPLIYIRISFPLNILNIFKTWPFNSMKSAAVGLKSDSLTILVLTLKVPRKKCI